MKSQNQYQVPSLEELDKISQGSYLMGALPILYDEIYKMMAAVQVRIFTAIASGEYSAEQGDGAWRELYAHHRLLKRLEARIKSGQVVGQKHADQMEI